MRINVSHYGVFLSVLLVTGCSYEPRTPEEYVAKQSQIIFDDEALPILDAGIKKFPDAACLYVAVGKRLESASNYQEAEECYIRALRCSDARVDTILVLADLYATISRELLPNNFPMSLPGEQCVSYIKKAYSNYCIYLEKGGVDSAELEYNIAFTILPIARPQAEVHMFKAVNLSNRDRQYVQRYADWFGAPPRKANE